MKRVLVTGASGFFGVHALKELIERGYEVHAVGRRKVELQGTQFHPLDVFDTGAAAKLFRAVRPTHMLHLAWNVASGFWSAEDNIEWASATASLIRIFHQAGGQRIVGVGTCAEYDWQDLPPFINESHSRIPRTLYGSAKESTRQILAAYTRQVGISHAWAVLFMSYGPQERAERLVPSVIRSILAGRATRTTSGTQIRDFLESRDVGAALAALVDSPVEGAVNVASGQPLMLREIICKLGEIAGRPDLVRLGDVPSRPDEPTRLVADIARLRQEVSFEPKISLERGLADAIGWWRKQM